MPLTIQLIIILRAKLISMLSEITLARLIAQTHYQEHLSKALVKTYLRKCCKEFMQEIVKCVLNKNDIVNREI